jgi:sn-glycerol 3-phosphate transport system substrate-binding protein
MVRPGDWKRAVTSRRRFLQATAATLGASALGCRAQRALAGRSVASLWFTYGGRNRVVLEELVDRFNRQQSQHWIEAVFQGDYFEGLAKLRTGIAAGAGPTFSHVIGEVVPYLDRAGVLEQLDGYPGAHDLDIIPELGQEKSWVGGGDRPLVALPFNRSTPIAYLNGELFEKAGLSPPSSWEELRAAARRLTQRQGARTRRYGFGCPISWWFWVALVGQAGGKIVEDDGRVTLGADHGTEAVEFWQRLVREDRSMKPPPGRDYNAWEATNRDFLAGRTAMIWTSTAFLKYLEDNATFSVLAAPLPAKRRRAVPTGGTHWIMVARADARAKASAWEFLRWVHQTQQVRHWATNTGYMPVTRRAVRSLEADGYYEQHPNDRVAVDQLGVAMPWPWSPELFRLQREIVQPRLERAILADADAGRLLDEARALARGGSP